MSQENAPFILLWSCQIPKEISSVVNGFINPECQQTTTEASTKHCAELSSCSMKRSCTFWKASQTAWVDSPSTSHQTTCLHFQFNKFTPQDVLNILKELYPRPVNLMQTFLAGERESQATGAIHDHSNQCLIASSFKLAMVWLTLRKPILNTLVLALNYNPVSNLPFQRKLIEKLAKGYLQAHLIEANIPDLAQSGFMPGHRTETALMAVMDDLSMDKG